jgi:hypothetical protein
MHSYETRKQIGKSIAENHKTNGLEGFPILLKAKTYPSISEASRQTTHSRDTIRRWLNDPNNTNCVAMDTCKSHNIQSSEGLLSQDPLLANTGLAKRVSIYGVTYTSIADAARQRNCSRANIQRLLRNEPNNCFIVP